MKAIAWTNGRGNPTTGSGYGIRLSKSDRDKYFDRNKSEVTINLDNGPTIIATLAPSFWRNCTEIRKKEIGAWIFENLAKSGRIWEKSNPPIFNLIPLSKTEFKLTA